MEYLLTPRCEEHVRNLGERAEGGLATPLVKPDEPWSADYRSRSQSDRDRILYSSAFQRLAYVTQVTAPESGHTFHNRMSHSLKVAQVGRRNAERLKAIATAGYITGAAGTLVASLDEDAIEASCLGHDLGHPPFGHIAEEVLQTQAKTHAPDGGGFEGNAQSFRIVTALAQRASGGGLDLTRQTLDGLLKYPWRHRREDPLGKREDKWGYYEDDAAAFAFARKYGAPETDDELPEKSLEAWIMEWADDLTYAVHDVDDFYRAGLIPLDRLADDTSDPFKRLHGLLDEARAAAPRLFPRHSNDTLLGAVQSVALGVAPSGSYRHTKDLRRDMRGFGSELITRYLSGFSLHDDLERGKVKLRIDEDLELEVEALKLLVRVYVIRRPGLAVVQHGQQRVVRDLFKYYYTASDEDRANGGDRRLFPPGAREALERMPNAPAARSRVVVDFISGMTETAAIQLHHRLAGGWTSPTLDATAEIG